jgi:hypothetical protein
MLNGLVTANTRSCWRGGATVVVAGLVVMGAVEVDVLSVGLEGVVDDAGKDEEPDGDAAADPLAAASGVGAAVVVAVCARSTSEDMSEPTTGIDKTMVAATSVIRTPVLRCFCGS